LADAADGKPESLEALFSSKETLADWLTRWHQRIAAQSASETATKMRSVNPIYIPRNHLVEEALDAASDDANLQPFEQLLAVLTNPFEERAELARFAQPASREFMMHYETFCGT
jgi:uncharacterized protein YdiU (UPF0061 family)